MLKPVTISAWQNCAERISETKAQKRTFSIRGGVLFRQVGQGRRIAHHLARGAWGKIKNLTRTLGIKLSSSDVEPARRILVSSKAQQFYTDAFGPKAWADMVKRSQ